MLPSIALLFDITREVLERHADLQAQVHANVISVSVDGRSGCNDGAHGGSISEVLARYDDHYDALRECLALLSIICGAHVPSEEVVAPLQSSGVAKRLLPLLAAQLALSASFGCGVAPILSPSRAVVDAEALAPTFRPFTLSALSFLNRVARLDAAAFQGRADAHQKAQMLFTFVVHGLIAWAGAALTPSRAVQDDIASIMHELLDLIGSYALCCPRNQECLRWGGADASPTILQRMVSLPLKYFLEPA